MNTRPLIGVIDIGIGNVRSVSNAIEYVGGKPILTWCQKTLIKCDKIILPGVGAFAQGMAAIKQRKLDSFLKEAALSETPILGICLGAQLLTETSEEFGLTEGLKLLNGNVVELEKAPAFEGKIRLPHVAWKPIEIRNKSFSWLFHEISSDATFYFIHSLAVSHRSIDVVAVADYCGVKFGAIIGRKNIIGMQFHPEKSGINGLKLIHNFVMKKGKI